MNRLAWVAAAAGAVGGLVFAVGFSAMAVGVNHAGSHIGDIQGYGLSKGQGGTVTGEVLLANGTTTSPELVFADSEGGPERLRIGTVSGFPVYGVAGNTMTLVTDVDANSSALQSVNFRKDSFTAAGGTSFFRIEDDGDVIWGDRDATVLNCDAGDGQCRICDNAESNCATVDVSTGDFSLDDDSGLIGSTETGDPCGGMGEGSIFYNDTSNYYCYCDGTNDVQLHDPATACF